MNSGNLAKAREDFDKAASVSPRDARVLNNRGFFNYKTGNNKAAIEDLDRALKLNPAYDNARYNLGLAITKQDASDNPSAPASQTGNLNSP